MIREKRRNRPGFPLVPTSDGERRRLIRYDAAKRGAKVEAPIGDFAKPDGRTKAGKAARAVKR